MSAYLSPMVFEDGDRILTRGNWVTLSNVRRYPDGGLGALLTLRYDDEPDNSTSWRVDFDMSVLYLTEKPEPVQLDLYAEKKA